MRHSEKEKLPPLRTPSPSFSWDDVDNINRQVLQPIPRTIPTGTFTSHQYAERYGIGMTTARSRLFKLVTSGKMIAERMFLSRDGVSGAMGYVYRPVKGRTS